MNPHDNLPTRRDFLKTSLATGAAASGLGLVDNALHADESKIETVNDVLRRQAAEAPLRMRFDGTTEEECLAWQKKFGATLRKLLGPHQPPQAWKVVTEDRVELEDHSREQLRLEADGHPALPIYVLRPRGRHPKNSLPGVLAIHGHGTHGYETVAGRDDLPGVAEAIENANYDYGRQLARRGYAVVCPCMTPFGRRIKSRDAYGKQDPCAVTFVRMQLLGKVLMAENLRDCLWAFEHLARDEQVDSDRMACIGLSYGGRMTMLTSALEPRVKVAGISGALNVMQERISLRYSCGAQVIPGLLEYGDVPEISSLIAPRHCVFETGTKDGLIVPNWDKRAFEQVAKSYSALGVRDRLQRDVFEGGHRWNGEVVYPLLDRVLKL